MNRTAIREKIGIDGILLQLPSWLSKEHICGMHT